MIRELVLTASLCLCLPLVGQPQDSTKEPPVGQETPKETPKPPVKRIRIGGKVAASQLIHKVQPDYPPEAREKKVQGTVHLHVILSKYGEVKQADVVSGDPILAKAAVEAVRQWTYKLTLLNGEPVEVDTTVDVMFSLKE